MHGTAKMTGGGLKKKQFKYNKHGKIVSRKASTSAKKTKNLQKAGTQAVNTASEAVNAALGGNIKNMQTMVKHTSQYVFQ